MKRRILSVLLSLVMLIGLLPTAAMAVDNNVAEVNGQQYATLAAAITAAQNGDTITLADGTYKWDASWQITNKAVTFAGSRNAVIDMQNVGTGQNTSGAELIFDGVTLLFARGQYQGFQHTDKVVYKNCALSGRQTLYAPTVEFNNCELTHKSTTSVWTYGATDVKFVGCTFNSGGRAVQIYNESKDASFVANVSFANCTFKSDGTDSTKTEGLVHLNRVSGSVNEYNLTFTSCGTELTNDEGRQLWVMSENMDAKSSVTIDSVKVYPVVTYVAQIGETQYETLQDAIDAADANDEIVMLCNTAETGIKVAAGQTVVIDFNGKTLTGDILSEGNLTVKNGTINSETFTSAIESKGAEAKLTVENMTVTSQRHALRIEGGEATINGGTFTATGRVGETETVHALNAGGDYATTVTINGGTFNGIKYDGNAENADSGAAVNAYANATVTINGGTFGYGQNKTIQTKEADDVIIYGGTFDQDPAVYVDLEKYAVAEANGTYTVKARDESNSAAKIGDTFYRTFTGAINDAEDGDIITLLADVEWVTGDTKDSSPLTDHSITIDGQNQFTLTATGAGVGRIMVSDGTLTLQNMTVVDKSVAYTEKDWEYGYLEFGGTVVANNVTFNDPILFYGTEATFTKCTFTGKTTEMAQYGAWVHGGEATFTDCTFTGTRGLKAHSAYDYVVTKVTVTDSTFNVTDKPGVALGDVTDAVVTIKNSAFNGVAAGDQNQFTFESDTTPDKFTLIRGGNAITIGEEKPGTIELNPNYTAYNHYEYNPTDYLKSGLVACPVNNFYSSYPFYRVEALKLNGVPTLTITPSRTSMTGGGTVTLTVECAVEEATLVVDMDGAPLTPDANGIYSVPLPNKTQTYTFTVFFNGNDEYNSAIADCTVSVTKYVPSSSSSSSSTKYPVIVEEAEDGEAESSRNRAERGDTVTITVTPDEGYELDTLIVTDAKGNEIEVKEKNGKFTFTMPGSKVFVEAAFTEIEETTKTFSDVPAGHPFAEAVAFASKRGIIEGYADGSFGLANPATVNAAVVVVSRTMGQEFYGATSVAKATAWAAEMELTTDLDLSGYVTREVYMILLWRAAGMPQADLSVLDQFSDRNDISEIGKFAMSWGVENGLIEGYSDGTVRPNAQITRGAMAAIAMRYMLLG